jgi:hypothetical protein
VTATRNAELSSEALKCLDRIVASNENVQGKSREKAYCAKNGFQSFNGPVIADEEENEIFVEQVAAVAGLAAEGKTRGRRELRRVDRVRNNGDILALEVVAEKRSGALGDGGESDFRIAIDAALEAGEKGVVQAPMHATKETEAGHRERRVAGEFAEAMKECVDENDIRIKAIDSRGEDKVESKTMHAPIPGAPKEVQERPKEKLHELRAGDKGDLVPDNRLRLRAAAGWRNLKRKILDSLRVEMDFAMRSACQALEKLREGALGSVAAVNKG